MAAPNMNCRLHLTDVHQNSPASLQYVLRIINFYSADIYSTANTILLEEVGNYTYTNKELHNLGNKVDKLGLRFTTILSWGWGVVQSSFSIVVFKIQLAKCKRFLIVYTLLMSTIYLYHSTQVAEVTVFLTHGKTSITQIIAKEGLLEDLEHLFMNVNYAYRLP